MKAVWPQHEFWLGKRGGVCSGFPASAQKEAPAGERGLRARRERRLTWNLVGREGPSGADRARSRVRFCGRPVGGALATNDGYLIERPHETGMAGL